jgi:CBS domain-containing protein
MLARDLAQPAALVDLSTPALDALRQLSDSGLPGLVVRVDRRYVVVPSSQVLRIALPRYVLDDMTLGRVWDEGSADALASKLAGRTVAYLLAALDRSEDESAAVVDGDTTAVEIASVMALENLPLVAVVDRGEFRGVVTVDRLIEVLLK